MSSSASKRKRENRFEQDGAKPRPFIKWVGGKAQLLPELLARIPEDYNRYFEPFIGGGALFFALRPKKGYLSDINDELINAYKVIKERPEDLIRELRKHYYDKDYFYEIRNVDRTPLFKRWGAVKRASRLIFLNKTCFNGLYRVNLKGEFNTPFGSYKNPRILDEENLFACSQALRKTVMSVAPFDSILKRVTAGDFVYFDPPYAPLSATANFTGYSKGGFDASMQVSLRDLCHKLDRKGVLFMASNSSAPLILDLYQDFNLSLVKASRAINSKGHKRGKINEVIVTNYLIS